MSDQTNKSTKYSKRKHFQTAFHSYFAFSKTNKSLKMHKMEIKMRGADKTKSIYLLVNPKA